MVILWLVFALIVAVAVILVLAWKFRGEKFNTDYYAFYCLGLVWLILGIAGNNTSLMMLGVVFGAIGMANKSKWKKKDWTKMSKGDRRWLVSLITLLLLLLIMGVFILVFAQKGMM
ncbi:hypothetical protein ACFL96_07440 [Thermoproteota archaeon]